VNPLAEIVLEPGSLRTASGVVKLVVKSSRAKEPLRTTSGVVKLVVKLAANLVAKLVAKSGRAGKPQDHLRCSKAISKASSQV
jgi:hypothetical protein